MINANGYKKATQALNFFAKKKGGKINRMKALKLIYFADRLHLRTYGRPIIGDDYWAMQFGPVPSCTDNIAKLSITQSDVLSYAKKYIKPSDENKSFISVEKPDMRVFSQTERTCLESVYKTFSDKDQFELAEITHKYPEWLKHEKMLKNGKRRVRMDYADFFDNPKNANVPFVEFFASNKSDLDHSKESFEETCRVLNLFSV